MSEITPTHYYKRISLTGFYVEQELLKLHDKGKEYDKTPLKRIARKGQEMFGVALKGFSDERSALARVKRERRRLVKSGWKRRPVRAVVTKPRRSRQQTGS